MPEYHGRAALVTFRQAAFGEEMIDVGAGLVQPVYRYRLTRRWEAGAGTVNFIMLNPSVADAYKDDPTIRRCLRYAMDWGYQQLQITNLFALRSTDPELLYRYRTPIGPLNDKMIRETAEDAQKIVCAWGVHGAFRDRGRHVLEMLSDFGRDRVYCFGRTKGNAPRHPLYLPKAAIPERWWP